MIQHTIAFILTLALLLLVAGGIVHNFTRHDGQPGENDERED